MGRYVTLGADENGEVYGLALGEGGRWARNSLGLSTSCKVIRPMKKDTYEYLTGDPQSVKELWQASVADGRTELGLDAWFSELDKEALIDQSFVFGLLDDEDNPTVSEWYENRVADGDHEFESFRQYVCDRLVRSRNVTHVKCADDVYTFDCSGWFPPNKPFVVEFAPKDLLEEYYAHLRETYKEFIG